jgi:hypothetical protein
MRYNVSVNDIILIALLAVSIYRIIPDILYQFRRFFRRKKNFPTGPSLEGVEGYKQVDYPLGIRKKGFSKTFRILEISNPQLQQQAEMFINQEIEDTTFKIVATVHTYIVVEIIKQIDYNKPE